MKKGLTLALAALIAAALSSTSCSSPKIAKASYPEYTSAGNTGTRMVEEVEEKIDACEEESLNEPASEYRAYGSAVDEDYDFARHQAILSAKAALTDRLQTSVVNAMRKYRDKVKGNGKEMNEGLVKQDIASISEQILENCRVICSKRYRMSDGTYKSAVCVSIPSSTAAAAADAAAMSEDERLGVEYHAKEFRDSYKEDLERFRQQMKERR